MKPVNRNTQKKIVRGLVRVWMMQKPVVILAVLAIAADITGVCLVANAAEPANPASEFAGEVSYEEAPAPVANVASYSDIFGGDTPKNASAKKSTTDSGTSEGSSIDEDEGSPTVLGLNSATKPGYMNNCYFLGDSRLVAMVSYGFVSDSNVLAKIGVSHTAVENTTFTQNCGKQYSVKNYLAEKKPPVVYVCYGVNGMNGISEEKYEKAYKDLVEHIMDWAPDSKIVLMSIWPVDDYGPYKGSVKNEWIEKYNDFLLALAEYEGIHYLDVASVLKGSDGQIKPEFDGGDGLHYRASAYNTIIDYIYHHPVKGISDEGEFKVKYVKPTGEFKKMIKGDEKLPANVVTDDTPTPTPVETPTPKPTVTPTATPIATPTLKPTPTPEAIATPSPSPSVEPLPTVNPAESPSVAPTEDVTPSNEPAQSQEPAASPEEPEPAETPTPIPTPVPSAEPATSPGGGEEPEPTE